jgi:hypothetical protein
MYSEVSGSLLRYAYLPARNSNKKVPAELNPPPGLPVMAGPIDVHGKCNMANDAG